MTRVLPVLPVFTSGPLSSASLNSVVNAVAFALNIPCFRMYQSVTQPIPNNAFTQATLDTASYDSDNGRSGVSPYTYTIPSNFAGRWTFSYGAGFVANATGIRDCALYVNGISIIGGQENTNATSSGSDDMASRTHTFFCNAGDQVGLYVYQNSGGSLNTDVSGLNGVCYLEGRLASLANP